MEEISSGRAARLKFKTLPLPMTEQTSRKKQRKFVVEAFLNEQPGAGTGPNRAAYRFDVEKDLGGFSVVLRRLAPLYKGFDFLVCVEDYNFNRGKGTRYDQKLCLS
ncbi:MAG: hypothetical protein ACOY58_00425 [Candidatus Micrarchaeota archaeon]